MLVTTPLFVASAGVAACALWCLLQTFILLHNSPLPTFSLQSRLIIGWGTLTAILTYIMGPDALWITPSLSLCLCLSLLHPSIAATILTMLFIIRPWEQNLPGDYLQKIPLLVLSCALVGLVAYKVRTKDESIVSGWNGIFFLLLMGWLSFNTLCNPTADSAQIFSDQLMPLLVIIFLVSQSATTKRAVHAVGMGMAIAILVVVGGALSQFDFASRLEGVGMWANSNDVAALAVAAVGIFAGSALSKDATYFVKFISLLCIGILTLAIFWTQSRGAFIGLAAIGFAIFFGLSWRSKLLLLVASIFAYMAFLQILSRRNDADLDGSEGARLNYAVVGVKMLKSAPILGVGLGNYPVLFDSYSSIFLESGHRTAHSSFVLAMAESGLPGLLLLLCLVASTICYGMQLAHTQRGLFLSFAGYLVMFSLLSHTYIFFPYLLFFLIQNAAIASRRAAKAYAGERLAYA